MEVNKHELNLLRHRFVEDTAAPIQVLQDPYFSQRLAIFDKDFNTLKDYKDYVSMVEKEFGGNVTVFLEQYKALRDRIITYVSNTDAFKSFCEDDKITKQIKDFKPIIGSVNLYTQEQVKKGSNYFLSFDMKKANFQTLRWVNPAILFDCETYETFIKQFTEMEWVAKSKRTREIVFGKLNPNRTMKYEKVLMGIVEEYIRKTQVTEWFDLFSMNSDELIYKLKPGINFKDAINAVCKYITEDNLYTNIGLHLRMEFFELVCYYFKTASSDKIMNVFVKQHHDGKKTYKCANEVYFPQTYKLINGMEVVDDDLAFYYDKSELAKFFKPIIMVENESS
jgi:hypothetical protein